MKLAILSDTHGLLRPQVIEYLKTADAILHAGDIHTPAIAEAMQNLGKDLYLVRGNNDRDWASHIPYSRRIPLAGLTFFLIHNRRDVPANLTGVDVVVYGHSHRYAQEEIDGVLWLNPGSCGPRRFYQEITMAMLNIEGGKIQVEKIDISSETP